MIFHAKAVANLTVASSTRLVLLFEYKALDLVSGGALWWGRSLAGEGPAVQFPRKHRTMRLMG